MQVAEATLAQVIYVHAASVYLLVGLNYIHTS
jgi:hypothetical protein